MASAAWIWDSPFHLSIRPLLHEVLGELLLVQGCWWVAVFTVNKDLLQVRISRILHGMFSSLHGDVRTAVALGIFGFAFWLLMPLQIFGFDFWLLMPLQIFGLDF